MRFYRLTEEDGTQHQRVEYILSVVEKHAAPALERLSTAPADLSAADRATLSVFFALQEGRTLAGLERIVALVEQTMEAIVVGRLADPAMFAKEIAQFMDVNDPAAPGQQRQYMIDAFKEHRVKLGNPKEVAVSMLLQSAIATAGLVYQMEWWLLNGRDCGFVTSDCALAMYDPTPLYPWNASGLMTSPNAQTTFPLDPGHCLLLRPGVHGDVPTTAVTPLEIDASTVEELNLRIYGFATRYIFAANQPTATSVRASAKSDPKRVVRPIPMRQLTLSRAMTA